MATKYLSILSSDRVSGTSNNFKVKFQAINNVAAISIISAEIPFTFWNIPADGVIVIDGNNYTLPAGHYSLTSLLVILNSMDGTWTLDAAKSKITCTLSVQSSDPYILKAIGLPYLPATYYPTGFGAVWPAGVQMPNTPDLVERAIYIGISNLPSNVLTTGTTGNPIFKIPITANYLDVIRYVSSNPMNVITLTGNNSMTYTDFNVNLTDELGNLLDLNGCDWSLLLRVEFVDVSKSVEMEEDQ
jgi:hypothetical protein